MRKPDFHSAPCAADGCRNAAAYLPHGAYMSYCIRHLTPELLRQYKAALGMTGKTQCVWVDSFMVYRGSDYITVDEPPSRSPVFECLASQAESEVDAFRQHRPDIRNLDELCETILELAKEPV